MFVQLQQVHPSANPHRSLLVAGPHLGDREDQLPSSCRNPWTTEAVNCQVDRIRIRMGKAEMKKLGVKIKDSEIINFAKTLKRTKTEKGIVRAKTNAELRCEAKRKLTKRKANELATRCSLYSLRHSFATLKLEGGRVDAVTLAKLMGHADTTMLSRVYSHVEQNPAYMSDQLTRASAS